MKLQRDENGAYMVSMNGCRSTDAGKSFEYRGVVADKPTVNEHVGFSGEGVSENGKV